MRLSVTLPASLGRCCQRRFRLLAFAALGSGALGTNPAFAFTHVVAAGETLASISEDLYGNVQFERVLVVANNLEQAGTRPILAGMRLEVPAPLHYRVEGGDTWDALALDLLGDRSRSTVLALANGSSPWLFPDEGAQILIPYNLRVTAKDGDDIVSLAYQFMGDRTKAWLLDQYNHLNGKRLKRGDTLLIPITHLTLTELGKRAAEQSANEIHSQAEGTRRAAQREVRAELPALIADVRGGRYVDAVSRAMQFLGKAELSSPDLALVHRQLLEAYVALESPGLATASCNEWRSLDPRATLDPVRLSPKIIEACQRGGGADAPPRASAAAGQASASAPPAPSAAKDP